MTREVILRDLVANGPDYTSDRLHTLADELDLLVSDVLVVAGHPVPAHLRPPARDHATTRRFARNLVTCDHPQLASVKDFVVTPSDGRGLLARWRIG